MDSHGAANPGLHSGAAGPEVAKPASTVLRALAFTVLAITVITIAAVGCDYVMNVILFRTPWEFTPTNTVIISIVVGSPLAYYLISQHLNLQLIKRQLSATITEKERARAEAEQALESQRESETFYRLLADNQTDVIELWNMAGKRLYSSPSVERTFGYSPAELAELPAGANVHPDDRAATRTLVAGLTPGGAAGTMDCRLTRQDGTIVWVEVTIQKLNDGSGCVLTTSRDISERKALQQDLVGALDEAKAALAVKADFLANMTHELRTPLNAIVGFSGLLKETGELNARDSHRLDLIWEASRNLLAVVNDVLDFSKLEAGAIELDQHPFDPAEVAAAAVALLEGQALAKGLRLTMTTTGADSLLMGDGPRLRQVLLNLISNAIKFTPRGQIEVVVQQSERGPQRRLRVEVRDTGIGVPPDQIEAIFGRFTQADVSVSRQFGGTGLGLAICKRIIEALGGEIGLTSTIGQGSTFWFEVALPVAEARLADERADSGHPVALAPTLRLLVVDDNATNRELISALLSPFDLIVETAQDGIEAVEAAARTPFDAILMDVQMPNMDGLTATRRIRAGAEPTERRVPIIAMTANVLPEQVARCLDAGMDDHIGKPINPQALIEVLDRWSPRQDESPEAIAPDETPPSGAATESTCPA